MQTGKTIASTLYFLAKNQNVQNKLRDELKKVLPTKETPLTIEILDHLSYLKAVIRESIRIAPIAVGNQRTTVKDLVLCGYQIPKGVSQQKLFISANLHTLFISLILYHRIYSYPQNCLNIFHGLTNLYQSDG